MGEFIFNGSSKNCLICGSDRLKAYEAYAYDSTTNEKIKIRLCRECEFAWQFPLRRSAEQSIKFFEEAYQDEGKTQSSYFNRDQKREISKLELEFVEKLPTRHRSVLDVGAGAGLFALEAAQNNWEVTAVDPALDISLVKDNKKIRPIKGSIADVNENSFDIVTLWDVIEHATNPVELLTEASLCLAQDGWLVIETGNFKSADRVQGGLTAWIYQMDHKWYFSPDSVLRLLNDLGFSEFQISEKVLRPHWKGSVNYVGPSIGNEVKTILCQPSRLKQNISRVMGLLKAKSWTHAGMGIFAIAARKK